MPNPLVARARGLFLSRRGMAFWAVGGPMMLAAVLAIAGLDHHRFWDDEANTAIYGRNLLESGKLTAWDGTNVLGYAYGGALGEDLGKELRVPPLPAYMAALGMSVFGQNTFGARLPFALAGVLSVGLSAVWLRRHLGRWFPWWLPALLLALSPAFLLYVRNCRYYAPGVLFTLLVWAVWAPGRSRRRGPHGSPLDRRALLRYAGGAAAVVLLMSTHYLNAATVLVTLPLFFIDRRYRQPRQYVLLGAIYLAAGVYAIWIWTVSNPFAAEYSMIRDWLFPTSYQPDWWPHFYRHLGLLLRDLGTHEFLPWLLVVVFMLPWLLTDARRMRPLALRGWILVGLVLVYVLLAALLTPLDMGKGRWGEMRYLVPLLAAGSAIGALALVILWHVARPLAPVAFVLLVMSNLLHLGFLEILPQGSEETLPRRIDLADAWWPPTLCRYMDELYNDYETGNEAMIAMLQQLPAGTKVRTWPTYMTHPAMFYAPELHYCDQLTTSKEIRADLRGQLPDYVFVETARPDVVVVPAEYLSEAVRVLDERFDPGLYELRRSLPPHWQYTSKPEIPAHFFSRPESPHVGMSVLVAKGFAAAGETVLRKGLIDTSAHERLGNHFMGQGLPDQAIFHYSVVLQSNPGRRDDYLERANAHTRHDAPWLAEPLYRAILRVDADDVQAHVGLALVRQSAGDPDAAIEHYREALRLAPQGSELAGQIEEALDRLDQRKD